MQWWTLLYPLSMIFLAAYFLHVFLSSNHKTTAKKVYYVSLFTGVVWIITEYLQHQACDPGQAGLFVMLSYLFASVAVALIAITSLLLAGCGKVLKALAFTPLLVLFVWIPSFSVIRVYYGWTAEPSVMSAVWAFSFLVPAALLLHTFFLFHKRVNNKDLRKRSLLFSLYSTFLLVFGLAYYLFCFYTKSFPFMSPVPVILYLALTYPLFGKKR